ncbi:MAG: DUF3263 domain-containing protein [Candidatus Nanopelagicales bacterium]
MTTMMSGQSSSPHPTTQDDAAPLNDVDRAVLALERRDWELRGAKEQAIHDQLGWSLGRYYQRLNAILDDPAALRAEPSFVWSLIRRRERSRRLRAGGPGDFVNP